METYHVTIKKRPNKKGIKQSLFAQTYLYHRSRKAHLSCKCLRFNVPEEDGAFIQLLNKRRCKIFYVIFKRQLKYLLKFGKIILSSSSPLLYWIIRLFSFLFFLDLQATHDKGQRRLLVLYVFKLKNSYQCKEEIWLIFAVLNSAFCMSIHKHIKTSSGQNNIELVYLMLILQNDFHM